MKKPFKSFDLVQYILQLRSNHSLRAKLQWVRLQELAQFLRKRISFSEDYKQLSASTGEKVFFSQTDFCHKAGFKKAKLIRLFVSVLLLGGFAAMSCHHQPRKTEKVVEENELPTAEPYDSVYVENAQEWPDFHTQMYEDLAKLKFPVLDIKYIDLIEVQKEAVKNGEYDRLNALEFTKPIPAVDEFLNDSIRLALEKAGKNYKGIHYFGLDKVYPFVLNNSLHWVCGVHTGGVTDDYVYLLIKDSTVIKKIMAFGSGHWDVFAWHDTSTQKKYLAIGGPDFPTGKYGWLEACEMINDSIIGDKIDFEDPVIMKIRKEFRVYGSVDFEQFYYDSLVDENWYFYSLP